MGGATLGEVLAAERISDTWRNYIQECKGIVEKFLNPEIAITVSVHSSRTPPSSSDQISVN